ncbi:MAG: hypothetical protein AB1512_28430 [Thermodesulfobacteriota bacterium]
MIVSATYVCPVRGLATLSAPEPDTLLSAARTAKGLGLDRLSLPVLEEALVQTARSRVRFLDGMVEALDRISDSGLNCSLIGPASRILGLDWAPAYLVGARRSPSAHPVFVDGDVRRLRPLDWWKDPSLVQRRFKAFRELVSAVGGHPALSGWVVLDRAMERARPEPEAADFLLRSFMAEIRERHEGGEIHLGLGWTELLSPELAQGLARLVDGIQMAGMDWELPALSAPTSLEEETLLAGYLSSMSHWLLRKPLAVEIGWGLLHGPGDPERVQENLSRLRVEEIPGVHWVSLVDPQPGIRKDPPWGLRKGLAEGGLLDPRLDPKEHSEEWVGVLRSTEPRKANLDFIDIGEDEYLSDPRTHLPRFWQHYRESI